MDVGFETKNLSILDGNESFFSENNRDSEVVTTPLKLSSTGKLKSLLKKVSINVKANIEYRDGESSAGGGSVSNEIVKRINNRRKRRASRYYLKDPENVKIEEVLQLEHLKKLRTVFFNRRKRLLTESTQNNFQPDNLNEEEFVEIISNCIESSEYNEELEKLFNKLDSKNTGRITWSDFCGHLYTYFTQKAYSESLKVKPFDAQPKIKHCPHNRLEVTAKILNITNPLKFINISRTGAIGIWNKNLTLNKRFKIGQSIHDQPLHIAKSSHVRNTMWITDAIMLNNIHKLVVATSARELRFFSISFEYCIEEFALYGLPAIPTCLEYWYDETGTISTGFLYIGDECGNIQVFTFKNPSDALFDPIYKPIKGVEKIYLSHLKIHHNFVTHTSIKNFHHDAIRKLKYIEASNVIISASSDPKASIVIFDLDNARNPYYFQMEKGCICFDYSKKLNMIVTGSTDSNLRLWDPYVTNSPTMKLSGHKNMIIDVKIHEYFDYAYSFSIDGVVCVWDLIDCVLIQKVSINFPTIYYHKAPEYGSFPLYLHSDKDNPLETLLLVSCDDYIASLTICNSRKQTDLGTVTHMNPISVMVYSSILRQVFTASLDSTLSYWNLENGQQILSIKKAHGDEEITAMSMDKAQRRLFTGARDGTIKVWNTVNGCNIQNYVKSNNRSYGDKIENEITGIVYIEERKLSLAVGWCRKITSYFDEPLENFLVKPKPFSYNGFHHDDDILCAESCSSMLATGSYDGKIIVWNTDNEKSILTLQKNQKQPVILKNINFEENLDRTEEETNTAPIDKLLFLKYRMSKYGLRAGILVSSQNGRLNFWSFYSDTKCLGSFYSSNFPNESILSLCTDEENTILVCGDSNGFVYIWDIENFLLEANSSSTNCPKRLNAFRSHDSSILSCEFVDSANSSYSFDLLITASTDLTCKLWDLNGKLIGTFGQQAIWDIKNPKTHANFNPFESSNYAVVEEKDEDEGDEDIEKPNSRLSILNAVSAFKRIISRSESKSSKSSRSTPESTRSLGNKSASNKYNYLSEIKYFKKFDNLLEKKDLSIDGNTELSRQERYKIYGDIQPHLVQRMPNISTPFLALKLPKLVEPKQIERTITSLNCSSII